MAKAKKKKAKVVKRAAKKTLKKSSKKPAKKTAKKVKSKTVAKSKVAKKSSGKSSQLPEAQVKIGQFVPAFTLPATGGQLVDIHALKGKKIVLYFYPKDATPGCTIEGHDFTKAKPEFESANALVFGVSRDSIKSHEKFKEKECYTIDLISDEKEELCGIFGVIKMKNMYGNQVRGIERSTFVIDAEGRLAKEWRGVKVEGHAAEVLDSVKKI
jgi:peroxiredoxin Q/BCP